MVENGVGVLDDGHDVVEEVVVERQKRKIKTKFQFWKTLCHGIDDIV